MGGNVSRGKVVGGWVAALIVLMACAIVAGGAITVGNAELWLVACLVPTAVLLLLWHGEAPLTAAQLIYAVDKGSKEGRP